MGLVENVILFVPEVCGKKAVSASFKIKGKVALLAVFAVVEVDRAVTIFGKEAFVAKFALVQPHEIHAVFVFGRVVAVEAVFFVV